MSRQTTQKIAVRIMGQVCETLDDLAQSAIAELANMISGRAGVLLERAQITLQISPPALVMGSGTTIATMDLNRLVVPLQTDMGAVAIHAALDRREQAQAA